MTDTAERSEASVLVSLARSMIQERRPDLIGIWPRATAILARQALEIALDQLWMNVAPGVENASARGPNSPACPDSSMTNSPVAFATHGTASRQPATTTPTNYHQPRRNWRGG